MKNKFSFPLFYWHLEISTKCALACPRCPRTYPENKGKFAITELPLRVIEKTFTPDFVREHMDRILFCGGRGDPIYHSDLPAVVRYFKKIKPEIQLILVTNGSHRQPAWWRALARELNESDWIVFSVDGWDDESNQKYRVGSKFASILEGIEIMVQSPATVQWSSIYFRFNQHAMKTIEDLARSLGVDFFGITRSMKFGDTWASDPNDPLEPGENYQSQLGRYEKSVRSLHPEAQLPPNWDIVEKKINRLVEDHGGAEDGIFPRCMVGERGMYVNAEGVIYPCGWLSHLGEIHVPVSPGNVNPWQGAKSELSVADNTLESVLNSPHWEKLFSTWRQRGLMHPTCRTMCAKSTKTTSGFEKEILLMDARG